jgi:hypothetical protein
MNPTTLVVSFLYRDVQICKVQISTQHNRRSMKYKYDFRTMSVFLFLLKRRTKQNALLSAIVE